MEPFDILQELETIIRTPQGMNNIELLETIRLMKENNQIMDYHYMNNKSTICVHGKPIGNQFNYCMMEKVRIEYDGGVICAILGNMPNENALGFGYSVDEAIIDMAKDFKTIRKCSLCNGHSIAIGVTATSVFTKCGNCGSIYAGIFNKDTKLEGPES
jgi:hypothetical protein